MESEAPLVASLAGPAGQVEELAGPGAAMAEAPVAAFAPWSMRPIVESRKHPQGIEKAPGVPAKMPKELLLLQRRQTNSSFAS